MATYLQGITDYIPQIQPFRPDFNFYNKALQMKQSKYDAAHKQLSNLYGSLLNSPMLRDQNIQTRQEFFQAIDQDIKRMSGVDLSLQQNVDAASDVFNQLLDNKDIVLDMVQTKNYQNQLDRSAGFKNCADIEKCGGGWWEGGDRDLEYWKQDFQNATAEQARRMRKAEYVPYQDISKKALELAKEYGDVSSVSMQGGHIIKTTNGRLNLAAPLKELFLGSIAKDPKIMEYYKAKARVNRKDWVNNNIDVYGSKAEAEAAYYNTQTDAIDKMLSKQYEKSEADTEIADAQKKQVEKEITTKGTTPQGSIADAYVQLRDRVNKFSETTSVYKEGSEQAKLAKRNGINPGSMESLDRAMAALSLDGDLTKQALLLAERNKDFDIKVDEFALEDKKQSNRLKLAETQAWYDMVQAKFEADLELETKGILAKGGAEENMAQFIEAIGGAGGTTDEEIAEARQQAYTDFRNEAKNQMVKGEVTIGDEWVTTTINAAKGGDNFAKADMKNMMDAVMNLSTTNDFSFGNKLEQSFLSQKIIDRYKNMSEKKKQFYASSDQGTKLLKDFFTNPNVNSAQINEVYKNVVKPTFEQLPKAIRGYLKPMSNTGSFAQNFANVEIHDAYLEQIIEEEEGQLAHVTGELRATGEENDVFLADFFDVAIDNERNVPKSTGQIINEYKDQVLDTYLNREYQPDADFWHFDLPHTEGETNKQVFERAVAQGAWTAQEWQERQDDVVQRAGKYMLDKLDLTSTKDLAMLYMIESNYSGRPMTANQLPPALVQEINRSGGARDESEFNKRFQNLITNMYATSFTKFGDFEGLGLALGLAGKNGKATQAAHYNYMDPAHYTSEATKNFNSYLRNMTGLEDEDVRIDMGEFSMELPDMDVSTNENKAIMDFIRESMITNTDDEKDRPYGSLTYQHIAGNEVGWVGVNFKPNAAWIKKHTGSESNPGIFYNKLDDLTENGITMYMRKEKANNAFTNGFNSTIENKMLEYGVNVPVSMYSDLQDPSNPLRVEFNKSTRRLDLVGGIQTGVQEDGTPIYSPMPTMWQGMPIDTDVNALLASNARLAAVLEQIEQSLFEERKKGLIKDPNQL